MAYQSVQSPGKRVWEVAARQHGVVTRAQLLELGFTPQAILHRVRKRRLHPVMAGVFALGRPQLTQYGRWMVAVLACGEGSMLSHASAAALWRIRPTASREIHVSVPTRRRPRRPGITVHRRASLDAKDVTLHHGIPVTTPEATLIDIAPSLTRDELEAAINEADKQGLTTPDRLRSILDEVVPRPGTATVTRVLDQATFVLTDSQLERIFLPLARKAGLSKPLTQQYVNGYRVDFYWPDLRLVVETDGLTYHRTPAQQAADRRRDQALTAAGLTVVRFTHAQIRYEPAHVVATLRALKRRP